MCSNVNKKFSTGLLQRNGQNIVKKTKKEMQKNTIPGSSFKIYVNAVKSVSWNINYENVNKKSMSPPIGHTYTKENQIRDDASNIK